MRLEITSMTKLIREAVNDSPTLAKVFLALMTILFAFNAVTAGAQYWLYAQDQKVREDFARTMQTKCGEQDKKIEDVANSAERLKARQDRLFERQELLVNSNLEQDRRMAENYVDKKQYSLDLGRIEGYFQRIETKIDSHMLGEPVLRKKY
jgi:hypothetical protein